MRRPLPAAATLLAIGTRLLVLEDLNNPTNVGAVFRCAAALGIDAVLLSPRCADPLYRRAVRVSIGAVLTMPYTRIHDWPAGLAQVRAGGYRLLAPAPDRTAPALGAPSSVTERLALVLGAEGPGLSAQARREATCAVRIPMAPGVDSLNVAAAAAIACFLVGARPARP